MVTKTVKLDEYPSLVGNTCNSDDHGIGGYGTKVGGFCYIYGGG
jgi:hypothetical protein